MLRGPVAAYTQVDEGTWKDYALQAEVAAPFVGAMSERVPAYLEGMARGLPAFKVDRDNIPCTRRPGRYGAGECGEIVIAALVHDIGDVLAPEESLRTGLYRYCCPTCPNTRIGWCCNTACSTVLRPTIRCIRSLSI